MLSVKGDFLMLSDIEIARAAKLEPIENIGAKIGLTREDLELYGPYKAKLADVINKKIESKEDGKLVLVTAISPTPAGEGKSTTTVGLAQALALLQKKVVLTLREPSLGPCMGIKGGAAGGGYSQVLPMDEINLHFTGDLHAITTAHNLLAAMIDNSLQQGNPLQIDPRRITWPRVVDMNDRALRHIVIGMGGKISGVPREGRFDITVASEVMAILCLASDIKDLKDRLGRIVIGYTYDGQMVTAGQLKANGAMTALLKDALKPNLVQTIEGVPALIHGGPFANIAHGCNSVKATQSALKLGDIVVTEAGFGADLGAEKFFDIKCRFAGLKPDATVLVATIRALKMHGGVAKTDLKTPNVEAVKQGLENMEKHIENLKKFGVPIVVAINVFQDDTEEEMQAIRACCEKLGVPVATSEVFGKGGQGGIELANTLLEILETKDSAFKPLYEEELPLAEKIRVIAREIYHAKDVVFEGKVLQELKTFEENGYAEFPVCIAKTQYSFSDDPNVLGRADDTIFHIREVRLSAGAGFIVALAGSVMTMPGLPKHPAAENIDIDEDGNITGLF